MKSKMRSDKVLREVTAMHAKIFDEAMRSQTEASSEQSKGAGDLTAEIETKIEQSLARKLVSILPNSFARGEEGVQAGDPKNAQFEWLLDPIDGTINFLRTMSFYSSVISLRGDDGHPILGSVYVPAEGRILTALRGQGTQICNSKGNAISTVHLEPARSTQSLFSVMLTPKLRPSARHASMQFIDWSLDHGLGTRLLVSQAYEATKVATGQLSGMVSFQSSGGWARDASRLLVEEAGGCYQKVASMSDQGVEGFVLADSESTMKEIISACKNIGYEPVQ